MFCSKARERVGVYVEVLEATRHAVLPTTAEITQNQRSKIHISIRVGQPLLEIRYALIVEFAPSWMIAQEDMQSCLIRVAAAQGQVAGSLPFEIIFSKCFTLQQPVTTFV